MTITFFTFNVFSIFIFCRSLLETNLTYIEIFFDIVLNIIWDFYYFIFMFMVIYAGAALRKVVNKILKIFFINERFSIFPFKLPLKLRETQFWIL